MKKILCVFLTLALLLPLLPAFAAEAEPSVILFDDFSEYAEGTEIPTKRWTRHIKNDTTKSSGKAFLEGDNMVCRFSIEKENTNSGPELVRAIDLTGMEDMTITCRAKQSGGTKPHILIYTDGVQNAVVAETTSTTWTDIKVVFDFKSSPATYTATVGSVTTTGELKDIYDLTQCEIHFKQNITSTKFGFWDDISITSYTVSEYVGKDESEWFAWTIPDESKAKGTAIDASFLLDKPAGKHGFVKADGDHFVFEDGTPARFWGTNVVFNANNMSYKESEILADRIARSGYNIVRMHMFDTSREPNIFAPGTTRTFDEQQLDKLFYFTSELKERGVYIYMDLLVYRKAYAADGIEAVEDVDNKGWKAESHYDDYLIFLQKEYAEMLLTRVNPYTGLAYKDDPQMAMIGITNEAGVVFLMHAKGEYPSTEYYQNILNEKFNNWLWEEYASEAQLKSAWAESGKIGLEEGESYTQKTVRLPSEPNAEKYSVARRQAHMDFLTDLQIDFYAEMKDYLQKDIGVQCPCTGTALGGYGATRANLYSNAVAGDYISRNAYYGNNASTLSNAQHLETMASARVYGKPFVVTEWCAFEPMPYIAESKLLMSTYAQLQNWNMIHFQMWHENTLPGNQAAVNSTFVEYQHPVRTALSPATSQNFLRGAIEQLDTAYFYPQTYADGASITSTGIPHHHNTAVYAKSGVQYEGVATNADAGKASVLTAIENKMQGANAANITDAVYWDMNKADFRLQTEYTQGVAGFRRGAVELDYVTFEMDNVYYTAILNSMTRDTIADSERLLLSVASGAHNTNREVSPDNSEIVKDGKGPVLVEPVTGKVTLKLGRDAEVYALTSSGERKEKLATVKDANGNVSFELTSAQQTLNYEICNVGYSTEMKFVVSDITAKNGKVEATLKNRSSTESEAIAVITTYNGAAISDIALVPTQIAACGTETVTRTFKKPFTDVRIFLLADFLSLRILAKDVYSKAE